MAFSGPFTFVHVASNLRSSASATQSPKSSSNDGTLAAPSDPPGGRNELAPPSAPPRKFRSLFRCCCKTANVYPVPVDQPSVASGSTAVLPQRTKHEGPLPVIAQNRPHTPHQNDSNPTTAQRESPTLGEIDSAMQNTTLDQVNRDSVCLANEINCSSKHWPDESNDAQSKLRSVSRNIKTKLMCSTNAALDRIRSKLPWLSRHKHNQIVEELKQQLDEQHEWTKRGTIDVSDSVKRAPRNAAGQSHSDNDPGSADEAESEQSSQYAVDRRDWAKIRAISDLDLRRAARVFVKTPSGQRPTPDQLRVTGRTEGSYHQVIFMEIEAESQVQEFVIRIPAHGTEERWQRPDEDMLNDEAVLMKYIRHNTKVPVPKVLGRAFTVWNEIGAPFIIMEKLPGKQAYDLWYENSDGDSLDGKPFFIRADQPSEATEAKRINFLRSLAVCMAELGKLQFKGIGIPHCDHFSLDDEPTIRPTYHWVSATDMKAVTTRGPFYSSQDFIQSALDKNWDVEKELGKLDVPEEKTNAIELRGLRKLIDIIYSQPVFSTSPIFASEESFVLRHNDLDLQNILVDEDGNVTGILDWDRCNASPRCIGTGGAVPKFLNRDWHSGSDMARAPHMAFKLEEYRKIYYEALKVAGCKDAIYTLKSPIYQAAIFALYTGYGPMEDFLQKVVDEIPGVRGISLDNLAEGLGYGWPTTEEHLRREIEKLLRVGDTEEEGASESLQVLAERAHIAATMLARTVEERCDTM